MNREELRLPPGRIRIAHAARLLPHCGWLILLALLGAGCEAPLPNAAPDTRSVVDEDAFPQWRAILDTPPHERNVIRAAELASVLAEAEGGLGPMVAVLADVDRGPEDKVFALLCLTTQREALRAHEPELVRWVAPDQPRETRKFAAHALGMVNTASARAAMAPLVDDPDQAVREAAMGVLLSFHPDLVVDRLDAFWRNPQTSDAIRDQVVLGMPPHLVAGQLAIYADAVNDVRLSPPARLKAIEVIGELGGAEHAAVLEQCVEMDMDDLIRERARGALALLNAGGASPATEEN
ncbi:MAG: HEAT repeat domain-containing protein [Candidatus Hydrogenedentes bacterium]|nr:HEAT repeat domain-containing protein [Candidatus Hydrogenedentota bacterium]